MCASSNVLSPFFTLHDEQAVTYNKENFSEKSGHKQVIITKRRASISTFFF
jgi:hypothetical protein